MCCFLFFFFNDTATTEIYTLSLHDALPICMLALCERLTDTAGRTTDLWGLLPGHARMQPRLAGLGMQQLPTPWGLLRGHTFHYSRLDTSMAEAGRDRKSVV